MSARFLKAQRRLHRDLQELADRSWELPTVSALPLEDDILEWHCNIVGTGESDGVVLHLKLLFPETYPHQPPEVVLMSKVSHPHVFGDHLCLDMLEEGQWSDAQERDAEFTGWSTCYSVFSILMQLQAFIFDLGNNARKTKNAAAQCSCVCGHGADRVYPPLPTPLPPPARPAAAKNPFRPDDDDDEATTAAGSPVASAEEVAGRVVRVQPYGVFVELGDGSTGLLHRSEMPRGAAFEQGEALVCRIKERSPKLSLTLRRSEAEIAALARSCERVPALVTGVRAFGAFVDLGCVPALLHRSEMDLLPQQRVPFETGDSVRVRLLPSDKAGDAGKLAVSARALFLVPGRPQALVDGDADLERLHCFHSKACFTEAVLGVGVGLEAEEVAAPGAPQRFHLASIYDTLAHESFQDGVRKGVWKQKFSEFLPLAMDESHFARARRVLEASLARLSSGRIAEKTRSHGKSRDDKEAEYRARITLDEYRRGGNAALQAATQAALPPSLGRPVDSPFSPEMVLEVIPKLMNSQVVMMASGQLWRCEKALEGYYAYHHLLLHCLRAYPALRTRVETKLAGFVESPEERVKSRVHNLGEFMCLVSISDRFGWADIGIPILEEAFDRNVLWILRQAPFLGEMTDAGVSPARLKKSFNANRVSLRLLMFQVAFLKLAKPPHVHEPGAPPCQAASCALERKDRCKGLPCPGEVEWLFDRCLRILDVQDFHEFLELVGAAPMDDMEICRWLRRSVLRSIAKDYHSPGLFRSLAAKASAPKAKEETGDPDDFGMDTRPKESKADKRARKKALLASHAAQSAKNAEYQRALSWARFYNEHGDYRQAALFLEKESVERLESALGSEGKLQRSFGRAQRGFRLLDGVVLSKITSFPAMVWLGQGCRDCSKAVTCEASGRCMPCCIKIAKAPLAPQAIKGVTATSEGAPAAQFTAFQARAVTPVEWEMYLDVGFDDLVADVAPLRAALGPDLVVTGELSGGQVFSRVERMGKRLWETSPEQSICPGAKLVNGWQGVTDAIFTMKVRGVTFTLLEDTMHNLRSLEDLKLLKMARTYCKDHVLRDPTTKELIWNRPCKNCRGILRLRFVAPDRYKDRHAQLERLSIDNLAKRAQLCGLEANTCERKELLNLILKCEGIVR